MKKRSFFIFQDWQQNGSNAKGRIVLTLYRLANLATINRLIFVLLVPYLVLYRLFIEWILGCEIPYKTSIGSGIIIYHGHSLVINDGTIIGNRCTIRHCTTIGSKKLLDSTYSKSPIIGDDVDIGSNVCIIGPITIGNNVTIGAGSVVIKDVPSNTVVAGNPAKIIRYIS
ncbi:serine O-acetyltransferase [Fibrella arboris]|uniref:serine O-acetyltransferase n=1 Tax=Fibrella arboris TaxID=3242486 RepID=UPI003522B8E8